MKRKQICDRLREVIHAAAYTGPLHRSDAMEKAGALLADLEREEAALSSPDCACGGEVPRMAGEGWLDKAHRCVSGRFLALPISSRKLGQNDVRVRFLLFDADEPQRGPGRNDRMYPETGDEGA